MRSMSAAAKAAIFSQETDKVFLPLLEISHPTLEDPLRFVNNTENVTSNGDEYIAFHFDVDLPGEQDDQLPRVTLTIDNIDRAITQTIRSLTTPPTIRLWICLADTPDTIEAGPFEFELAAAEGNALTVSGELAYEPILNQRFPSGIFNPGNCPGLF